MRTVCLVICLLLSSGGILRAGEPETLILAADFWCPYNCDPGSEHPGYAVELAREIFAAVGVEIEYQRLNWSRALLLARNGEVSGLIGVTPAEAPELVFPDEPIGVARNSFWVGVESSWRYQGPDSLQGLSVGVIRDYDYGHPFNTLLHEPKSGLTVQWLSGETALIQNIRKLAAGRVDMLIEDDAVFRYTVRSLNMQNRFRRAGIEEGPDEDSFVYIAFSPDLPDAAHLAEILSRGLNRLRRTGRLQMILAEYGLQDWKE